MIVPRSGTFVFAYGASPSSASAIRQRESPDVPGADLIRAVQLQIVPAMFAYGLTITNIPAAITEIGGGLLRLPFDVTMHNGVRCIVRVLTPASAGTVRGQVSVDGGGTWANATGPVAITAAGTIQGNDATVTGAIPNPDDRVRALFRIISQSGNGADDPVLSLGLRFE